METPCAAVQKPSERGQCELLVGPHLECHRVCDLLLDILPLVLGHGPADHIRMSSVRDSVGIERE